MATNRRHGFSWVPLLLSTVFETHPRCSGVPTTADVRNHEKEMSRGSFQKSPEAEMAHSQMSSLDTFKLQQARRG
ncbi:hypothetical protein BKA81DRAFT_348069, partial [Phyllosticta paracitricarpa]